MKVIGLDLSLTSTGVAVVTEHGAVTDRITSKGSRADDLRSRWERLHRIRDAVQDHVRGADLVIVEGPAFSRSNPGMHDRSGLWWLVVDDVIYMHPVAVVDPMSRAKYATGRGNAAKDDVLSAVIRRYPTVDVNGNDEADALILAAMGARHLGQPIEPRAFDGVPKPMPQTHLDAMAKVAWPEHLNGAA